MFRRGNLMTSGSITLDRSGMFEDDPLINFIKGESSSEEKLLLSSHALQRANVRYKSISRSDKEAESLLHLAIKYHNPKAVKVLVDAGIEKNQTTESLTILLIDLFSTNALFDRQGTAAEIYEYFSTKPELARLLDSVDPKIWDDLLVISACNAAFSSLQVMVDKKKVKNFNATDSEGHTALYYVEYALNQSKPTDTDYLQLQTLQSSLVAEGAILNAHDLVGLDQQKFYVELMSALKSHDQSIVISSISKLLAEPRLLTDEQFEKCFICAVKVGDVEAVKLFLTSSHMPRVKLFHEHILANIHHVEIAKAIASYSRTSHAMDKMTPSFHLSLTALAHRIGLSGEVSITPDGDAYNKQNVQLEGNTEENSVRALRIVIDAYAKKHPDFSVFSDAINFTASTASIRDPAIFRALMAERLRQEKSIIINSGWVGHSIGLGVRFDAASNKTYISISNRGDGSLAACLVPGTFTGKIDHTTGTVVYEMDGMLKDDFFEKFGCFSSKFNGKTNFSQSLADYLKQAHVVAILPAGMQGHGTCSYVNTKRVCEGLLYIDRLITANGSVELNVMNEVRDRYKDFSSADKRAAYADIIKLYHEVSTQAPTTEVMHNLALLEEFIAVVFIQRGSLDVDPVSLHKLYQSLPASLQASIPEQYKPEQTPSPARQPSVPGRGFFHKTSREIFVFGEPKYVKLHEQQVSKLIAFLKDNHLDGIKIRKIKVESDSITIYTTDNPAIKADIRDNLFKGKLSATVKNVSGEYYFKVEDFPNLTIPLTHTPKKTV